MLKAFTFVLLVVPLVGQAAPAAGRTLRYEIEL
jgi:hypothetical protein